MKYKIYVCEEMMKKISDYCFCAVCETYFTKQMQDNGCTVLQMYKPIPKFLKLCGSCIIKQKFQGLEYG